jgi:glycine cleavage system aminomethyltransferase T
MSSAHVPQMSLQDAIDRAGSAVRLLWKPNAPPFRVPVVKPEYAGWREEQAAWSQGVALSDLSHHMSDLFIEGPDATRLLSAISANDYESFAAGQAKQFVPVTADGHIVTDGILMREGRHRYVLSGVPAAQSWVQYHAAQGGYEASLSIDPDSAQRGGGDPVLFRYQIQGPRAPELIDRAFGGPLPKVRFFHSAPALLAGRTFRAFRHGMTGQTGYELIGNWRDGEAVKEALMSAGKAVGLVHVGGLAYATNGIESGWIPTPTPGIYAAPELEGYRRFLSARSYEGMKPLHGSFFSESIEDYYVSPYELGYGKSIALNHEFIGRAALEKSKDRVRRTKVTLAFNADEVRDVFGANPGYLLSYGRHRVEAEQSLAGMTFYSAWIDPVGTILSLALVERRCAAAGTAVTVAWGEHPGPDAPANADSRFARLRAIVQPAPYNEFARTQYRKDP